MSLISDALKRAQENAATPPPPSSVPPPVTVTPPASLPHSTTTIRVKRNETISGTQLHTVPPPMLKSSEVVASGNQALAKAQKEKSSGIRIVIGILVFVFVLGGGAAYFGRKFYRQQQQQTGETLESAVRQITITPVQRAKETVKKAQENQVIGAPGAKAVDVVSGISPVAAPPKATATKPVETSKRSGRTPPTLNLQGVTVHAGKREALINGMTVRVGDEIEGAKVVEINSDRVKLEFDGMPLVVSLF